MTASVWWKWKRLTWVPPPGRRAARFRPSLEALEDRTVLTTPTSTILHAVPPQVQFGANVAFIAQVIPLGEGGVPGGAVTFLDVTNPNHHVFLGTVALAKGQATLNTTALSVQQHLIEADYLGDGTFDPSKGNTFVLVTPANTNITLSANPATGVFGQPVTFTAKVTPTIPNATPPTGQVDFFDTTTGTDLGTVGLDGKGSASLTTSTLAVGEHKLQASYDGDTNFLGSAGFTVTAVDPAPTTTTLAANPAVSLFGQPITFTATLTPTAVNGTSPTGQVDFFDTTTSTDLGKVSLDGKGSASLTTSALAIGTHKVRADYSGDGNFLGSTGATDATVQGTTTTTLAANPVVSVFGQPVTLTANVAANTITPFTPTGNVDFVDTTSGTDLGPVPLDPGPAHGHSQQPEPGPWRPQPALDLHDHRLRQRRHGRRRQRGPDPDHPGDANQPGRLVPDRGGCRDAQRCQLHLHPRQRHPPGHPGRDHDGRERLAAHPNFRPAGHLHGQRDAHHSERDHPHRSGRLLRHHHRHRPGYGRARRQGLGQPDHLDPGRR
jgi:hypothetical protein